MVGKENNKGGFDGKLCVGVNPLKHYIGDEDEIKCQRGLYRRLIYRDHHLKPPRNGESGNGHSIITPRKKTSQLLHFAGMEVQDIFEDIADPNPEGNQHPYAVCIRKLDHHFRAEENIPFERREGEPWINVWFVFVSRPDIANFGTSLDHNLRDRSIEKLTDMELKIKLLETKNVT